MSIGWIKRLCEVRRRAAQRAATTQRPHDVARATGLDAVARRYASSWYAASRRSGSGSAPEDHPDLAIMLRRPSLTRELGGEQRWLMGEMFAANEAAT